VWEPTLNRVEDHVRHWLIDWVRLNVPPTQYRSYRGRHWYELMLSQESYNFWVVIHVSSKVPCTLAIEKQTSVPVCHGKLSYPLHIARWFIWLPFCFSAVFIGSRFWLSCYGIITPTTSAYLLDDCINSWNMYTLSLAPDSPLHREESCLLLC